MRKYLSIILAIILAVALAVPVQATIPQPTLNMVFREGVYYPQLNFYRASSATRVNALGRIETVPADTPRIDYDPVTGEWKGLLIEEQRTNLLTYSQQFDNAAWTKTRASITANAATAPDGTLTADKLVEDSSATTNHYMTRTVTVSLGTTYKFSLYVKAAERSQIILQCYDGATYRAVRYNLAAGTVDYVASGVTSPVIKQFQDGWFRVSMDVTIASGTSAYCQAMLCEPSGNGSYTGDGSSGLYIWGAQLESGVFATSYIPTEGSAVTRAADVATVDLSSFAFNAFEGTIFAEGDLSYAAQAGFPRIVELYGASYNNRIAISLASSQLYAVVVTDSVNQGSPMAAGTVASGQEFKVGARYATNDLAIVRDGGAPVSDTDVIIPTVSGMGIGRGYGGYSMCGHIRHVQYVPRALSSVYMQTRTR